MKLVKPSFEILDQGPGLEGIYKQIELAARNCYKSEAAITEDSAKKMVDGLIASKHFSCLEHGTVYLKMTGRECISNKYRNNPYSVVKLKYPSEDGPNIWYVPIHYITTNYRILVENGWLDDLQYLCEPTEYHEKRVTVRFITDRGVLAEYTRHRTFSFAVESTRYCNYSADKFNNEITFTLPAWCNTMEDGDYGNIAHPLVKNRGHKNGIFTRFVESLMRAERDYFELLNDRWKPEQARNVLPLATKCDMIMTGYVSDWTHFFDLRSRGTTGKPHPSAKELAEPLMEEFQNRGLI